MLRNLIVLPGGTMLYSGAGTENAIKSVTVTESVNSGTELTVGSVCCSCLEATIITPQGGLELDAGDEVTLYKFENDGDLEDISLCKKVGTFLLEKPTRPTPNTLKLTAYDYVSWLDKDLSDWLRSLDGWPYTVIDFAKMVCTECGLQANEATIDALPNGDYQIQKFAVSVTGRKLMEWVGQIAGRFFRADKDGYVEFAWYEPAEVSIGGTGSYYFGGSLSYEDYAVVPVEKVQIRLTEDDVGVVYPDGDTTEKNTYIITGNYLLSDSSTETILPIAQSLQELLSQVSYWPLKVTVPLDTDIHAGQTVLVTDRNGKEMPTYVMTAVQRGQKIELESTGSHRRDSTTVVNYETLHDLRGRVLSIQKSAELLRVENKSLDGRCAALEMQLGSITMEVVNDETGAAASIKISSGEKVLVDSSSPRAAFANSTESAVEITGNTIAFTSNTLIVNSDYFTLDRWGNLTARGAEISGTISTASGLNETKLQAGQLSMYYDSTEYGEFASSYWKSAPENRGVALHIKPAATYISFSQFDETAGTHVAAYVINWGLDPGGHTERHIFYNSARFLSSVTIDGTVYLNAGYGITVVTDDSVYYGVIATDASGNITIGNNVSSVTLSGSTTYIGSFTSVTYVRGSTLHLGNTSYPTNLIGKTISIIGVSSLSLSGTMTVAGSTTFSKAVVFDSYIDIKGAGIRLYDSTDTAKYYMYMASDVLYVGEANHKTYLFGSEVEIRNLIDPTLDHHAVPKRYVDGKFIGRMRLLTSADDCNDLTEDGIYWYSTSSVPANAPFANAAIIEVFGNDSTTTQKIQRGTRYGTGGHSAMRALYGGNWSAWYQYAVSTDGVLGIGSGGTGGTSVATAQAALLLTKTYMFSQTNASGVGATTTISSYPTTPGIYRVGNKSIAGLPSDNTGYGCLLIFNAGTYVLHLYVDNSRTLYYALNSASTTTTGVSAPGSWYYINGTAVSPLA